MIYRKAPPQPPKLLLRIVSAAGAGVLVGAAACGGVAISDISGVAVHTPDDSGDALGDEQASGATSGHVCNGFCGPLPGMTSPGSGSTSGMTSSGSGSSSGYPCGGGDCDAGPDVWAVGLVDAGILVSPDAGDADANGHAEDATNGCHVLGICIRPDAARVCLGVCIAPDE